jgi:hypothetical protein
LDDTGGQERGARVAHLITERTITMECSIVYSVNGGIWEIPFSGRMGLVVDGQLGRRYRAEVVPSYWRCVVGWTEDTGA